MALIISDPTSLIVGGDSGSAFESPVVFDTTTKTITITPGSGVLPAAADGVTLQALYSAAKIVWKNSATYIKYPFPIEMVTPESGEFINGWVLANDTTRKALRTCGWAEKSAGGAVTRKYMGIISLGSIGASDYSYYQWNALSKADFQFPGPINEAIQIYGDGSNGNFDYTDGDSLKLFNRIQGKKYSSSNNTAIGATNLSYITYRFPLSNETDLKIAAYATDSTIASAPTIATTSWATGTLTINTSAAHGLSAGARIRITGASPAAYNGVYTVASVVDTDTITVAKESDPGVFVSGTLTSIYGAITINMTVTENHDVDGDSINESYTKIITDASGLATTQEIYEKMQYLLRQNSDIDTGANTVIGATADSIASFVGDTLVGSNGVYISGLNSNYLNSVELYTDAGVKKLYPFISSGVINFGSQAGSGDFKYWMFYKTLPSGTDNDYGQANARIVKDKDGNTISGTYSGSAITWSFKYDSEVADYGGGSERTAGVDAPVVVVGIGLSGGQFISVEHTITKSTGQSILLAPAQERNFQNS